MSSTVRASIPPNIRERMYEVLALTVRHLFPPNVDPADIIKPHVWYDALYVGEVDGAVVRWIGWSVNCRSLDKGYRTLYIDFVPNVLPYSERERLYGATFADFTAQFDSYICMFVTGCPLSSDSVFEQSGYKVQTFTKTIHPCCITDTNDFQYIGLDEWSEHAVQLLALQSSLCQKRSSKKQS